MSYIKTNSFILTVILIYMCDDSVTLVEKSVRNEDIHTRLINGNDIERNSKPFFAFVAVFRKRIYNWNCGGSLITPNHVLTSASCLPPIKANTTFVEVILGAGDIYGMDASRVIIFTANFTRHENYNEKTFENNIGIIKLSKTVDYTKWIQPVTLPDASKDYEGQNVDVLGWGLDSVGNYPHRLQQGKDTIISNAKCKESLDHIDDKSMCISGETDLLLRKGDFGSPLMQLSSTIQIGIASHGTNCCITGYPTAYTKVADYLDWIKGNVDI